MFFFDPKHPNKYSAIKKLLVPYQLSVGNTPLTKQKFGAGDGGYVLAPELLHDDAAILSYGIGDDPNGVTFEESLCDNHKVVMFDPAIKTPPVPLQGVFNQEALTAENFVNHIADYAGRFNILKMDIEGHEYKWLNNRNLNLLSSLITQFTVEVHCLIQETPADWLLETQMEEIKQCPSYVTRFFERLNSHFHLFHIHGNNHSPCYVDLPDSLELTYINKYAANVIGVDNQPYPIVGLDEPNFDGRPDYVLDWWL